MLSFIALMSLMVSIAEGKVIAIVLPPKPNLNQLLASQPAENFQSLQAREKLQPIGSQPVEMVHPLTLRQHKVYQPFASQPRRMIQPLGLQPAMTTIQTIYPEAADNHIFYPQLQDTIQPSQPVRSRAAQGDQLALDNDSTRTMIEISESYPEETDNHVLESQPAEMIQPFVLSIRTIRPFTQRQTSSYESIEDRHKHILKSNSKTLSNVYRWIIDKDSNSNLNYMQDSKGLVKRPETSAKDGLNHNIQENSVDDHHIKIFAKKESPGGLKRTPESENAPIPFFRNKKRVQESKSSEELIEKSVARSGRNLSPAEKKPSIILEKPTSKIENKETKATSTPTFEPIFYLLIIGVLILIVLILLIARYVPTKYKSILDIKNASFKPSRTKSLPAINHHVDETLSAESENEIEIKPSSSTRTSRKSLKKSKTSLKTISSAAVPKTSLIPTSIAKLSSSTSIRKSHSVTTERISSKDFHTTVANRTEIKPHASRSESAENLLTHDEQPLMTALPSSNSESKQFELNNEFRSAENYSTSTLPPPPPPPPPPMPATHSVDQSSPLIRHKKSGNVFPMSCDVREVKSPPGWYLQSKEGIQTSAKRIKFHGEIPTDITNCYDEILEKVDDVTNCYSEILEKVNEAVPSEEGLLSTGEIDHIQTFNDSTEIPCKVCAQQMAKLQNRSSLPCEVMYRCSDSFAQTVNDSSDKRFSSMGNVRYLKKNACPPALPLSSSLKNLGKIYPRGFSKQKSQTSVFQDTSYQSDFPETIYKISPSHEKITSYDTQPSVADLYTHPAECPCRRSCSLFKAKVTEAEGLFRRVVSYPQDKYFQQTPEVLFSSAKIPSTFIDRREGSGLHKEPDYSNEQRKPTSSKLKEDKDYEDLRTLIRRCQIKTATFSSGDSYDLYANLSTSDITETCSNFCIGGKWETSELESAKSLNDDVIALVTAIDLASQNLRDNNDQPQPALWPFQRFSDFLHKF